jgi:multifunctional methyltransferase subunit TRM112
MRNNTEGAGGNGFPLRITATEIRVDDDAAEDNAERQIAFVKGVLGVIDWPALVQAASQMGLSTLPPQLLENMANDPTFLQALYQILMNVHLVKGILTCPVTGREFAVSDGIPNMILKEEECEHVRM